MCQGLLAGALGWVGSVCPPCPGGLLPGWPSQHRHGQADPPHALGLLKRDWRAVAEVNCLWDFQFVGCHMFFLPASELGLG